MGFFGLGRSPLKHADPKRREQAVRDLPMAEQGALVEIALGDSVQAVRVAAAAKVREPEFLQHLSRHKDESVAKIARERLANVAVETIKGRKLKDAKGLLEAVTEQSALVSISLQAEDTAVRDAALERLLGLPDVSEPSLATVAIQEESGAFGKRVLDRLSHRQSIKNIAKKAKADDLRQAAKAKLAALDEELAKPSAEQLRRERAAAMAELGERAQALSLSERWDAAPAEFAALAAAHADLMASHPEIEADRASDDTAKQIEDAKRRFEARRQEAEAEAAAAAAASSPAPATDPVAERSDDTEQEDAPEAPVAPTLPELPEAQRVVAERLIGEAETLAESTDWKEADYRFKELDKAWRVELADLEKNDPWRERFMGAYLRFKERRRGHREQRDQEIDAALKRMDSLCGEAEQLAANNPEPSALDDHLAALKDLQGRWRAVPKVPMSKGGSLTKRFRALCDQAYEPIKARNEAREWERSNNVPKAEDLIARVTALADEQDLEALHAAVKGLQGEWKSVGPLPRARSEDLWQNFKAACDTVYERLQPLFAERDAAREAAAEAKEQLIVQLQEIVDRPVIGMAGSPAHRDAHAAKFDEVKAVQAAWKEVGPSPRERDREQWNRFKALLDTFFAARREHHKVIDQERQENLDQKLALISSAKELAEDAERFGEGQAVGKKSEPDFLREVKDLQRSFRDIGHVPRDRFEEIRDRFKTECDRIYTVLEPWFAKQDEERSANLEAKQALIKELEELLEEERPDWFMDEVKAIQQKWKDAGQVPRQEMAINDRFQELVDQVYERSRQG